MKLSLLLFAIVASVATSTPSEDALAKKLIDELVSKSQADPEGFAAELRASPYAAIVDWPGTLSTEVKATKSNLPLVFAHGMGDSCFNAGMKQITSDAGTHAGVYSVCVPTGNNTLSDTINGKSKFLEKFVHICYYFQTWFPFILYAAIPKRISGTTKLPFGYDNICFCF